MDIVISIIQVVLAVLLIIAIILQQKGSGLGSSFGGGADFSFYRTKRGAEKLLFYATIGLSFAFIISSIVGLFF